MASPRTALILGGLVAVFFALCVLLTLLTRNVRVSDDGLAFMTLLAFAAVGVVVARRQRYNPIGWILLSVALVAMLQEAAKLYLVLDYHIHHGALPLERAVVYWAGSYTLLPILIGMPAILLFPDGGVPSTRWRRALWAYVGLAVLFMVVQFASEAQLVDGPVKLRVNGEPC